ncbi:hypothetical protein Q0Z83_037670 [Actinoplanes sichuanensis]|uniref:Phosphodiesterase n=1 Tax=Actinoplanes sichuanensis TaxID=512349 RepID=A0ABW4A332_9ACTN|nr:hypothetical protein [Actinoplanes sichuanensis]BEL05576.1 hypothetical protein Q0Z83_037670 [Actinoplanes sichuanensis]
MTTSADVTFTGLPAIMRAARLLLVAAGLGLGVRVVRSRHRRSLHPAGRSFTGELEIWGADPPAGSTLTDRPGRHPVTVRLSKGVGTRGDRPDILGLAVRTSTADILLSTTGRGRLTRHLPIPRRTFDSRYGSITAYRAGDGHQVHLGAEPTAGDRPLGRTLAGLTTAARRGADITLHVRSGRVDRPFGRLTVGRPLSPAADATLAFNPVHNAAADLHPTGLIHGSRALAYRLSQRWRRVPPA